MSCEEIAQVHAYHDGEMVAARREAFEAHLDECADCRELLEELRDVSRLVATAPLARMPAGAMARLERARFAANDRSVLRITTWLTTAAAAVLVGSLVLRSEPATPQPAGAWQAAAVMPPGAEPLDEAADLITVAQWMATDLAATPAGEQQ